MHWWQVLGIIAAALYVLWVVIPVWVWQLSLVLADIRRHPMIAVAWLALFGEVLLFARARLDLHSVAQQVLWGVLAAVNGIAVIVLPDRLPDWPRRRKPRRVLPPDHWPE